MALTASRLRKRWNLLFWEPEKLIEGEQELIDESADELAKCMRRAAENHPYIAAALRRLDRRAEFSEMTTN